MNDGGRVFKNFDLDVERKILRRGGEIVHLPPKAVELLCVLMKNRGEVVSKNDLLEAVWENTFVEESVLSNNIYILRKTLSELGVGKNLIQTVPRRGYRFAGEIGGDDAELVLEHHVFEQTVIAEISDDSALMREKAMPAPLALPEKPRSFFGANKKFLFASTAILLLILSVLGVWNDKKSAAEPSLADVRSIAVIPLKSLSKEVVDENLRLRITDSLITNLGNLNKFSVRPTSSVLAFVGEEANALEVGKKLAVEAVLEGRVQQENGRLRVNLQLVSVAGGGQIWSGQFDGETDKLLNLQDAISAEFVNHFAASLTDDQIAAAAHPTDNSEAYELYLKGRYFWNKRTLADLEKAVGFYEQAIALDSNYADAYVGLADSQYLLYDYNYRTTLDNPRRAKDNLLKALTLKPDSADALVTLGLIQSAFDWDWNAAEKSFRRALEIEPNSASAHSRYGVFLIRTSKFAEARAELEKARRLDPLSLSVNMNLGVASWFAGDLDAAEAHFKSTLEIEPNFEPVHWYLARFYWHKGSFKESFAAIEKALTLGGGETLATRLRQKADLLPPDEAARFWFEEWKRRMPENRVNSHDLAIVAAYSGDRRETLAQLEKTVAEKHPWSAMIAAEPEFIFLRGEPRFQEILRQINQPK